jgi:hypothetical protein
MTVYLGLLHCLFACDDLHARPAGLRPRALTRPVCTGRTPLPSPACGCACSAGDHHPRPRPIFCSGVPLLSTRRLG